MAIQYVCDICGRVTDDFKFIMPFMVSEEAKSGVGNSIVLKTPPFLSYEDFNLCSRCREDIAWNLYAFKKSIIKKDYE